jgi:hypothetical protein
MLIAGWTATAMGVLVALVVSTYPSPGTTGWVVAVASAGLVPMGAAVAALGGLPEWRQGIRFFVATVSLAISASLLAEMRSGSGDAETLWTLGLLGCATGALPTLREGLRQARAWRGEPVTVGKRVLPPGASPWALRLVFSGLCVPAAVLLVVLSATYADITATAVVDRKLGDYAVAIACAGVAVSASALAWTTAASGRADRSQSRPGFLELRVPKRTLVLVAVAGMAWIALPILDAGPYKQWGVSLAVAAFACCLLFEALFFDVMVLQLVVLDPRVWAPALLCSIGAAACVFWVTSDGMWAADRLVGAVDATLLALGALTAVGLTVGLCGCALARPLRTLSVTKDPAWQNVAQDTFLYWTLVLLFGAAPAYVFERTSKDSFGEVALPLLGLAGVVAAFQALIELNRAHRRREADRTVAWDDRVTCQVIEAELDEALADRLRWHHWLQNSIATAMVAAAVGLLAGRLTGLPLVGLATAMLACWAVGAGWNRPYDVLRDLRDGFAVALAEIRGCRSRPR